MVRGNINKCPNCLSDMTLSKEPYIYHGTYIGLFEAYTCSFCNRVYFTEKAFRDIMAVPTSLDDFQPFEDQPPISLKMEPIPPFLELRSESDSKKNRVSVNEEDLIIS
jgi:hypothetical protein